MNDELMHLLEMRQNSDLITGHSSVLLTSPFPECEALYASEGFLNQVGFENDDVIGKNPKMFQGPETSQSSVTLFHELLKAELDGTIKILNYHSSGRSFEVEVRLRHLRNDLSEVVAIASVQRRLN